ncbi:MAG: hypothetical protein ACO1OB_08670 [Archangium sp.]
MLFAVLAAVLTTTPPPIPPESVPPPPEYAPPPLPPPAAPQLPPPRRSFEVKQPKKPEPMKDSRFALLFLPANVFALSLWVEGDLHLASGVSVFAAVGGGFLGQFGWDAGFRYYVAGTHVEGLYIDVRNSGFGLPQYGLWMTGPGVQLGYSFRTSLFVFQIAAGFTTWFNINVGRNAQFLGTPTVEAPLILFPGITRPSPEVPAVAPTLRFSFGPWF